MTTTALTHLLIFDVDGTLLKNKTAVRDEFLGAFQDLTGVEVHPNSTQFAGMTDRGIVRRLLEIAKVETDYEAFFLRFEQRFGERLTAIYDAHPDPYILTGVVELLEALQGKEQVALALGTGNCRSTCQIKLDRFDLWRFFGAGGFGGEHEVRSDALRASVREAEENLGWQGGTVWVIGDTVRDVIAGHEMGAKVMAVATGPDSVQQLLLAGADEVVADFSNPMAVMARMGVE